MDNNQMYKEQQQFQFQTEQKKQQQVNNSGLPLEPVEEQKKKSRDNSTVPPVNASLMINAQAIKSGGVPDDVPTLEGEMKQDVLTLAGEGMLTQMSKESLALAEKFSTGRSEDLKVVKDNAIKEANKFNGN